MSQPLSFELKEWADAYLDDSKCQEQYQALGLSMFSAFDGGDGKVSSQLRNLQSIANSAARFSEIELFIKNQMGRDNKIAAKWCALNPNPIDQLQTLADKTQPKGDNLAKELTEIDAASALQLRLYLAVGWMGAVVGGYMFAKCQSDLHSKPTEAGA